MLQRLSIIALAIAALTSCVKFDDATSSISVEVQLLEPEGLVQPLALGGRTVTMTLGNEMLTAVTDANGLATFADVVPDIYDLSVSWKISADEYATAMGRSTLAINCTVSGSRNDLLLANGTRQQIDLRVTEDQDIVIGKIASAGCKDQNNRTYMAGKYIELYNQSDVAVDVAGLYIGLLDSDNPQPYTLNNLHEVYEDSVVLIKQVFRIPKEPACLVQPGGTVLITNSATDHSDVSELEHDLRDADFEAKDESGSYQNNPAVPALEVTFTRFAGSSNMNLVQGGPCGVVIFRTDEEVTKFGRTYAYGKTTGTAQWLLLPVRLILDGVDYIKNKANTGPDAGTKRLPAAVDAGYTNINAINGWTGEVVYRRTASRAADGHAILEDTNNSSNDFQVSTTVAPRQYD